MFGIDTAKLIIYGVAAAVIAGVIWWFGFHNPSVIRKLEADNKQLTEQVAAGQADQKRQEVTKDEQNKIDKRTFQNISTRHGKPAARNSVVVHGLR